MSVARFRPSLTLREAAHFVGAGMPGKPPLTREFERAFGREVLGNRTVILAPSGRIALYWILAAMDMAPGDEVVTQAFNFTAVPAAIEAAGAKPVFVDVAPDGFGPDPEQLARVVGPRTRAVLITHLYGNPADLGGVNAVCEAQGIPLIEDCAQAVGATYEGRAVGTFGLATYFTFGPTKNFTLLGGGAVATADPDLGQRMAELARQHRRVGVRSALGLAAKAAVITVATSPLPFEVATFPAIRLLSVGGGDPVHKVMAEPDSPLRGIERYRSPSGAMAAVGLAQLKSYEDLNRARERNGWDLYQRLRGADGITVPESRDGNIFLSFPVLHPRRKAFAAALRRRGVDTDLGFMCDCASHTMFPGSAADCPEARRAAAEIVHLPVHPYLSERGRDHIVDAVVEAARVGG
jgi:perosamine synthetase